MALRLGGVASDVINHGSGTSLDDLSTWSFLLWMKTGTLATFKTLVDKTGAAGNEGLRLFCPGTGAGRFYLIVNRITTNCDRRTDNQALANNSIVCVAVTYDFNAGSGNAAHIYIGALNTPLNESNYDINVDGSGALKSNAANSLLIGNNAGANDSYLTDIAFFGMWNRTISLVELRELQFNPYPSPGNVLYCIYGDSYKVGTQVDQSNYGNHGTVTGTTYTYIPELDNILYPTFPDIIRMNKAQTTPTGRIFKLAGDGGGLAGRQRGLAA